MNRLIAVPTAPLTVTLAVADAAAADADRHATAVPLVHDDVPQCTSATVAVGVASDDANPKPLSIAIAPPLSGTLRVTWLTAGADSQSGHIGKKLKTMGATGCRFIMFHMPR